MEILRHVEGRGYPVDYLLARISVRRSWLVADWRHLLSAAEPLEAVPVSPRRGKLGAGREQAIWASLLEESAWVYGQMDERLRGIFSPVFTWFELKTLVLCLRTRQRTNGAELEGILAHSLLAEKVRRLLVGAGETAVVAEEICNLFARDDVKYARLRGIYGKEGVDGVERHLVTLFLEQVVAGRLHPAVGIFFRYLIDMTNIMTLFKQLRWRIKLPLSFIAGGRMKGSTFRGLLDGEGLNALPPLVCTLTGMREQISVGASPEPLLLKGLSRLLRREAREPDGIGLILDYLWRCYMEARNLSILAHCGEMDREILRTELLQ
ncbi:V-type ATPase subunit [Geotalea uraniireducens]|uniref:V-type ATPase subunit n=1 Tax=Geotalea uraniireducens TaxID=351604 RepID=UPI0002DC3440|nr:V-type ATPase subunit [Geotalea uraniireducens]